MHTFFLMGVREGFPLAHRRDSLARIGTSEGKRRWDRWIWAGLVTGAWKKGGAAARAHGRPQERMPAPVGGRAAARDCALRPFPVEPAGDGGAPHRGLGRADRDGLRGAPCAGDPGHQRLQLPHHGRAAARLGRDRQGRWPGSFAACDAGGGRGHVWLSGAGVGSPLDAVGASAYRSQQAVLGRQGIAALAEHCRSGQERLGRGGVGNGGGRSRERHLCRMGASSRISFPPADARHARPGHRRRRPAVQRRPGAGRRAGRSWPRASAGSP